MPRSVLLGRPWPQPGEELFTQEDTDYAIALAEEEKDTCSLCGYPKAWCRDPANRHVLFKGRHETCAATYAATDHRKETIKKNMNEADRDSLQFSAGFIDGRQPDIAAGLDIEDREV